MSFGKLTTETKDWSHDLLCLIIIINSIIPVVIGLLFGVSITIKIEEKP